MLPGPTDCAPLAQPLLLKWLCGEEHVSERRAEEATSLHTHSSSEAAAPAVRSSLVSQNGLTTSTSDSDTSRSSRDTAQTKAFRKKLAYLELREGQPQLQRKVTLEYSLPAVSALQSEKRGQRRSVATPLLSHATLTLPGWPITTRLTLLKSLVFSMYTGIFAPSITRLRSNENPTTAGKARQPSSGLPSTAAVPMKAVGQL